MNMQLGEHVWKRDGIEFRYCHNAKSFVFYDPFVDQWRHTWGKTLDQAAIVAWCCMKQETLPIAPEKFKG